MEQIDQKIIDKIQKLLNLKEGAEAVGNYHEAENAAARVSEFLLKYNLDLETVKASKIEQKAEMNEIEIDYEGLMDKRESEWVPKLYIAIANTNLCKILWFKGYVKIIGHKVNVMMVAYICEQMIAKIRIAEKLTWKEYTGEEKRGTFRRGFFTGAVHGIHAKLSSQKRDMENNNNPFALMVIHKEKEVEDYYYELYPNRRPDPNAKPVKAKRRKGPKITSSRDGWTQGYESGKNMSINKGMDTPNVKGHL